MLLQSSGGRTALLKKAASSQFNCVFIFAHPQGGLPASSHTNQSSDAKLDSVRDSPASRGSAVTRCALLENGANAVNPIDGR